MKQDWLRRLFIAGALAASGCSSTGSVTVDGGRSDAAVFDAGSRDAGPFVGSNTGDGGTLDSGAPDAGDPIPGDVDAGCLHFQMPDGGCEALSFARVCEIPRFMILRSGVAVDDTAGLQIGTALQAGCTTSTSRVVDVRDGGVLDGLGSPLVDQSEAFVVAGGTFTQPYVSWLETSGRTPVFDSSSGSMVSISRRDGTQIFTEPLANLSAGLDYFIVELVRGRERGPLSVVGYGFYAPGTTAAAWFFENRVMSGLSGWGDSWYVVRWLDQDGNLVPSSADQFSILASGH